MANHDKLKALILHLCETCDSEPSWGKTKLFKMLYFCDMWAYRDLGATITGLHYQRFENGPVPKDAYRILRELKSEDRLVIVLRPVGGVTEERPIAKDSADLGMFSGPEMHIIDLVIQKLRPMSARQVSDFSHRHPGWKFTSSGQEIPFELGLESVRPPSDEEIVAWRRLKNA